MERFSNVGVGAVYLILSQASLVFITLKCSYILTTQIMGIGIAHQFSRHL